MFFTRTRHTLTTHRFMSPATTLGEVLQDKLHTNLSLHLVNHL